MKFDLFRSAVRPLITYAFSIAMITGFFMKLIPPEVFYTVAGNVVSFWFGQRTPDTGRRGQT